LAVRNKISMDDLGLLFQLYLGVSLFILTSTLFYFVLLYLWLAISISFFSIFGILILYIKIRDTISIRRFNYSGAHGSRFRAEIDIERLIDEPIELIGEKKVDLDVKTFKISDYITLKLENNKTKIYVKGEKFMNCMFLMLTIPKHDITIYDEVESIDDAVDILDGSMEHERQTYDITPEEEFMGHCSNIQAWVENNYNTRILHSNISFPLLKQLVNAGDEMAKKVFGEEVVSRYLKGNATVRVFLNLGGFFNYLKKEQLLFLVTELIEKENKIDISADIRKLSTDIKNTFTLVNYVDGTNVDSDNVLEVHYDEDDNNDKPEIWIPEGEWDN